MKNQSGFINIIIVVVVVIAAVGFVAWDNDLIPKNILSRSGGKQDVEVIKSNTQSAADDILTSGKSTEAKLSQLLPITMSQNASDVETAQSNLAKINAQYQQMGIESGKKLTIVTPSEDNILEPGRPVTIAFSPVQGAASYEITITKPAYVDRSRNLLSADKIDTLFKEVTSETTHTIIVPKSDTFKTIDGGYNGEKIIVKALDRNGNQLKVNVTQQGKSYEIPAMDQKQINILSSPTQPNLLDADIYAVGEEGGTITLKFGALQSPYVKRKLIIMCSNQIASIDGIGCNVARSVTSLTTFDYGAEAFTKKMTIKANPFPERDTAVALMVSYYDTNGNRINSQGIDNQSWLSIKIAR